MTGCRQEFPLHFQPFLKVLKNSWILACGLCFTREILLWSFFAGLLFVFENQHCMKHSFPGSIFWRSFVEPKKRNILLNSKQADCSWCMKSKSIPSVDNTLRELQNVSYPTTVKLNNNCFIIHSKYFPVLIKGVSPFCCLLFCSPKNNTTSPSGFSVNGSITSSGLHFVIWCQWFNMTKFFPNLVNSSCLYSELPVCMWF